MPGMLRASSCLLGWFGEVLAYVQWDTTAPAYLWFLHRTLRLLEGDAYTGHGYTVPAFRGRGLHQAGHLMALQRARRNGCIRSISIVARWNAPALAVAEGIARRRRVGTVGYWAMGAARHYHASGAVWLSGQAELYVER
jgi:GNAT superfamily N-acetyltransferase